MASLLARVAVVWCPDWPAVAAATSRDLPAHRPVAVCAAGRVLACSAVARVEGVRRGMRRREAESRCPSLVVAGDDPERDARCWEPAIQAAEELVAGVAVLRPGLLAVPARAASGYAGGEAALAESLTDRLAARAGVECQVGVAGGLFAATLAAREGLLVTPGGDAAFLARLDIGALPAGMGGSDRPGSKWDELASLLRRLGVATLGGFAALPERDVAARFGAAGVLAHRLAAGDDERLAHRRTPPPELAVASTYDPPVERMDAAAFLARTLAEKLQAGLVARGLACTRLRIRAATGTGEELSRMWRCAEPLSAQGAADRVRWQLEGWLAGAPESRPRSGIETLCLEPTETVTGRALQRELWHPAGRGTEPTGGEPGIAACRALARLQGLLGADEVRTAVLDGGIGPAERVRLVAWGEPRTPSAAHEAPWPARLPPPAPATVPHRRLPARVCDSGGCEVEITGRGSISAQPHSVSVDGAPPGTVMDFAGPWRADRRWWTSTEAAESARLQVVLTGSGDTEPPSALLLAWRADTRAWQVEGTYD